MFSFFCFDTATRKSRIKKNPKSYTSNLFKLIFVDSKTVNLYCFQRIRAALVYNIDDVSTNC